MSKIIGTKPNQIPVNANLGELAYQDKEDLGLDLKVDKVAGKGLSSEDFSTADKDKLTNVEANATKNQTDAHLLSRANHTGTQPLDTITETDTQKIFTSDERAKLAGIASGATNTAAPVQPDWNAGSGLAAIANKPGNATTSADGLMSKEDKTKLNAVGTNAQGDKTVSTIEPSGGSNGDIWYQVE